MNNHIHVVIVYVFWDYTYVLPCDNIGHMNNVRRHVVIVYVLSGQQYVLPCDDIVHINIAHIHVLIVHMHFDIMLVT